MKKGSFWQDFKVFISKGKVVDMAVGVVIGASFGKIVTGLVNYVINPFVGIFIKNGNLDSIKTVITPANEAEGIAEVAILWGSWIQTIIDFLITAFCIFIALRVIMKVSEIVRDDENEKQKAEEAKKKEEEEKARIAAEEEQKAIAEKKREAQLAALKTELLLEEIKEIIKNKQ